jgi:hypothetical protein
MSHRVFTVEELEDADVMYYNHYKESRGKGRWSELFDIVFEAEDGRYYHVLYEEGLTENQDYTGHERFPEARHSEYGWTVKCPEVELYETMRPVTLFRKVEVGV